MTSRTSATSEADMLPHVLFPEDICRHPRPTLTPTPAVRLVLTHTGPVTATVSPAPPLPGDQEHLWREGGKEGGR